MSADECPLLEVNDLSVERSRRGINKGVGLRNVSLVAETNEVLVLAGETGSGTSLLGQLILGVAEPGTRVMSGTAQFEGEDLIKMSRRRRQRLRRLEISYLPRDPGEQFNPDRTVQQCLRECSRLAAREGLTVLEAEWNDWFYRVGIVEPERVLPVYIHQLSSLLIRKLGLMRALITRSKLLICDNVLADLDRVAAFQFYELVVQLKEESDMAVLMMAGNLRGWEQYADRVAVFYEGGILEEGTARKVMEAPDHPYTREFLACHPNLTDSPRELPTISRDAIREAERSIHGADAAASVTQGPEWEGRGC